MDAKLKNDLKKFATQIRIGTVDAIKTRGFGHIGGSLSVADTLAVLYGNQMRYKSDDPTWADRDKLVCSKGHAGPAVYAALGLKGFFPYEDIRTLNQPGTNFPSHCDKNKTAGVDITTGSLGQGTSLACGMAIGDKIKGRDNRVFLIVGDGELDEGQCWEAFMFASAKKLSNLVVFLDVNKKQLDSYTEDIIDHIDLGAKMQAFGFDTQCIDGNDVEALYEALEKTKTPSDKPFAIVLDTVKGAGVPDVENTVANHSMVVSAEQGDKWIADLQEELNALSESEV